MSRTWTLEEKVNRRLQRVEKRRNDELPLLVATGTADVIERLPTRDEVEWMYHLASLWRDSFARQRETAEQERRNKALYVRSIVAREALPMMFEAMDRKISTMRCPAKYCYDLWLTELARIRGVQQRVVWCEIEADFDNYHWD